MPRQNFFHLQFGKYYLCRCFGTKDAVVWPTLTIKVQLPISGTRVDPKIKTFMYQVFFNSSASILRKFKEGDCDLRFVDLRWNANFAYMWFFNEIEEKLNVCLFSCQMFNSHLTGMLHVQRLEEQKTAKVSMQCFYLKLYVLST